jgi:hypothetical protein
MENTQYQQQLAEMPSRLAKAQVDAERARYELENAPKEFELQRAKHELNATEAQNAMERFRSGHQNALQLQGLEANQKTVNLLRFPEHQAYARSKPPEYWLSPEGAKELEDMRVKEFNTTRSQAVSTAAGKAAVQQNALTAGTIARAPFSASWQNLVSNTSKQAGAVLASGRKQLDEALKFNNMMDAERFVSAAEAKANLVEENARNNPNSLTSANDRAAAAQLRQQAQLVKQQLQQGMSVQPAASVAPQQGGALSPEQQKMLQGDPNEELDPAMFGL